MYLTQFHLPEKSHAAILQKQQSQQRVAAVQQRARRRRRLQLCAASQTRAVVPTPAVLERPDLPQAPLAHEQSRNPFVVPPNALWYRGMKCCAPELPDVQRRKLHQATRPKTWTQHRQRQSWLRRQMQGQLHLQRPRRRRNHRISCPLAAKRVDCAQTTKCRVCKLSLFLFPVEELIPRSTFEGGKSTSITYMSMVTKEESRGIGSARPPATARWCRLVYTAARIPFFKCAGGEAAGRLCVREFTWLRPACRSPS